MYFRTKSLRKKNIRQEDKSRLESKKIIKYALCDETDRGLEENKNAKRHSVFIEDEANTAENPSDLLVDLLCQDCGREIQTSKLYEICKTRQK